MIRSFIAFDLPAEIKHKLSELGARLRNAGLSPVGWVPVDNIHITLKFLGEIPEEMVQKVIARLKSVSLRYAPFEVDIRGLGAFPRIDRARVIWVGCEFPPKGMEFQSDLEKSLSALGFETEKREFHAHLTLARVSRNVKSSELDVMAEIIKTYQIQLLGSVRVDTVHLYRSNLLPGGAQYQRLFSAALSK